MKGNWALLILGGVVVYLLLQRQGAKAHISNEESWEIVRDPATGSLQRVIVHRNVQAQ